jgi:hypothetical protein
VVGDAGWAADAAEIHLPGEGPDTVLALRWRDTNTAYFATSAWMARLCPVDEE